MPIGLVPAFLDFFALFHTSVARVGVHVRLLAVQQRMRLGDVVLVGGGGAHCMHQPGVGIDTDWASPSFPDGLLSPSSLAQSQLG